MLSNEACRGVRVLYTCSATSKNYAASLERGRFGLKSEVTLDDAICDRYRWVISLLCKDPSLLNRDKEGSVVIGLSSSYPSTSRVASLSSFLAGGGIKDTAGASISGGRGELYARRGVRVTLSSSPIIGAVGRAPPDEADWELESNGLNLLFKSTAELLWKRGLVSSKSWAHS